MPDLSWRRAGPLDAVAARATAVPAASLTISPPCTKLVFRGRESSVGPAGSAFGVALPRAACRLAQAGARAAWWLGPDEWLLLAPERDSEHLFATLEAALGELPHALVDVSHRSAGLELAGPKAAYVLSHGCPLDLALPAFPVGMCTRTLIGKAEVAIARVAPETFQIDVWRSFADYVWRLLVEARRELA